MSKKGLAVQVIQTFQTRDINHVCDMTAVCHTSDCLKGCQCIKNALEFTRTIVLALHYTSIS